MKTLKQLTRFVAVVAMMAVSVAGFSQTTSQRINEIKRGGKCIYAEATAADKSAAQSQACQLLAYYINGYITDNGLNHARVSADDIPGVRLMDMARGSNVRVFAYADRNIFTGEATALESAESVVAEAQGAAPVAVAEPVAEPVAEQPVAVAEPIAAEPVVEQPVAVAEPVAVVAVNELASEESSVSAEPVAEEPEADTSSEQGEVVVGQKILADLGNASGIQEALKLLGRGNAEYVIKRFGPYNTCKNTLWCYWLVYNSEGNHLDAFIAPGPDGERYDLLTGEYNGSLQQHLGNGKMAVWFELR